MPKNAQKRPKTAKIAENYITRRIIVEKFIPGGQALATLDSGQKIFLWNALPSEIVTRALITKTKSSLSSTYSKTLSGVAGLSETPARHPKERISSSALSKCVTASA